MSAELIVLSVGAAAAALILTRVLSLRADARGDARSTGRARDLLGRAGTAAHGKRSGRRRSHERTSEPGDPPRSRAAGFPMATTGRTPVCNDSLDGDPHAVVIARDASRHIQY